MQSYTCNNKISYQKWYIGTDIREILLASSAITAQVGQQIYPIIANEKTIGDFILYERDKYSKNIDMHSNVYEDECVVSITAIADNYDDAVKLASNIDNTLTGIHTRDDGFRFSCMLQDSTETYTDEKYIETLTYKIN